MHSLFLFPVRRISSNFSNFNFAISTSACTSILSFASHSPFVKELQLRSTCKSQILIAAAHLSNFNLNTPAKYARSTRAFLFPLLPIAAGTSHYHGAASRPFEEAALGAAIGCGALSKFDFFQFFNFYISCIQLLFQILDFHKRALHIISSFFIGRFQIINFIE